MEIKDLENKIFNADCLEFMKNIPDKSIDLVLTDPPYNISKKNNFSSMERYNKYRGMDFGEWDKGFNQTEWIDIVAPLLKDDANVVIFNSWQNIKEISDHLEKNGLTTKRILVLRKTNPMPVNRDRLFANSFEFIIWAVKGKWTFNREKEIESGFFECKNNGETKHPTEKQLKTIKELLNILSNEGQVILDPFLGSGTTAVAAIDLKRRFIGIEKEEKYFNIAKKRIEKFKPVNKLF